MSTRNPWNGIGQMRFLYPMKLSIWLIRRRWSDWLLNGHCPRCYPGRLFVELGGLISYAADGADNILRLAGLIADILKGKKPQDIPISQPTKFELVINLKTAKAQGIDVPPLLLARADEVIE
jgi:ABC transporter substrate binding protein